MRLDVRVWKRLAPLALAVFAAGCGLALARAAPDPPVPAPAVPSDKPAVDPGLALIQARCVFCHEAGLVLQTRRPAGAWRDLVNEMISRGAEVTDSEADQIQAYLEKNQSVPPPSP